MCFVSHLTKVPPTTPLHMLTQPLWETSALQLTFYQTIALQRCISQTLVRLNNTDGNTLRPPFKEGIGTKSDEFQSLASWSSRG